MNCKKVIFKNLSSVPNIYKCWMCGQIPNQPQFKHCIHFRLLTCFQCLKLQRCRQCRVDNLTYYSSLDTPEIFTIYLRNIFIHCQNCHNHIQGFKFSSHENKCFQKFQQITNFELLNKNICCLSCLDYGQFDNMNKSQTEQCKMNIYFLLKQNIHFNEEYLIQLSKFQIKCQQCVSILLFINLPEHQNSCPFINVKCENYGCNWIGQREQFQIHVHIYSIQLLSCFPLSQNKLEDQNYFLNKIEEFTIFNILKNRQDKVNNDLQFQNIFNSIQMIQFTRVESENEDQFEYEDQSNSD